MTMFLLKKFVFCVKIEGCEENLNKPKLKLIKFYLLCGNITASEEQSDDLLEIDEN
jgi:hypothetical protein